MAALLKAIHLASILLNLGRLAVSRLAHAARDPGPASARPTRILILAYTAVGDFVFLIPTLRVLRNAFPDAHITCLGNRYPSTGELLPILGLADEHWTIESPYGYRQATNSTLRRIREGRFDAVLMSLPTSARFFGSSLLRIPIRVGHCRPISAPRAGWSALRYGLWRLKRGIIGEEFERRLILNRKVWLGGGKEHMALCNLRLLGALGLPVPEAAALRPDIPETEDGRAFAERMLGGFSGEKLVGLHLGSPGSLYAKIWPPEKWAQVCLELSRDYRIRLVVVGGREEAGALGRFEAVFRGPFLNLSDCGALPKTLSAIRRCALFLSSDTGLAKAAMAQRVPTVTIWGPSDRPGYGILWDPDKHLEIYRVLPCAPCVHMGLLNEGAGVINFSNCGHRACLAELTPQETAAAIRSRYHVLLSP